MKLRRQRGKEGPVVFEEIEPFFFDLLRRLPDTADPADDAAAKARLFSAPMAHGGDGDEFNEDWERYVEPEIRSLFRSARDTVEEDLSSLPEVMGKPPVKSTDPVAFATTSLKLEIPFKHAEAWLSVLNQARLVVAARRGFGERDMDEDLSFPPLSDRDMDLFRVHFYDFVQQVLLRELGFE